MLRYSIINWLIKRYGYKSYLEIGVADGECYNRIKFESKEWFKIGVDPDSKLEWINPMTSDEFFELEPPDMVYDIIFIDGLHTKEQVEIDIDNSLKHLADGGTIVVHDCNPPMSNCACLTPRVFVRNENGKEYLLWNGDVWKAWVMTRILRKEYEMYCVDADWGCGIIRKGPWIPISAAAYTEDANREWLTYPIMALNRTEMLGLITVDEFCKKHSMALGGLE